MTRGGDGEEVWQILGNPNVDLDEHMSMDDPVSELGRTLAHEAVHVFMLEAAARGWVRTSVHDIARDHQIIRRMGLRQCSTVGECASSCGPEDTFITRFVDCVEPVAPINASDIRCEAAEDYCEDRQAGNVGVSLPGSCVPSIGVHVEPECLATHCSYDGGDVASLCFEAYGGAWFGNPVFPVDPGPGPRPPRPMLEQRFELWRGEP